ncbi:MAG: endo alpha-1,4 polygalactosaminidase [Chloroflexi bacterium]|nr:endo alpha-1,4 polygalactosaminidase [Chloroflexota bacterium]
MQEISDYAKGTSPNFLIIPQNGEPLVLRDQGTEGATSIPYLVAIDGIGRETVFCGERRYDERTPSEDTAETVAFLEVAREAGVAVMATDYCSRRSLVDESYVRAAEHGYLSFVASTGNIDLDAIPSYPERPMNENSLDVTSLRDARNFLYLINPDSFETKRRFLEAMRDTNYDIVLIDLFFDGETLTPNEVASLKKKANGGSRLAIAYVNIGAAEDYRYYWQPEWRIGDPGWLAARYKGFEDEAFVRYWDPQWKSLIFGNDQSYLKKVMDAGFDGAYLDNVLAYEVFEEQDGR